MVREDLPEPDTPVTTTSLLRGMVTVTFLRLCTLAPFMRMESLLSAGPLSPTLLFLVEMDIVKHTKISRQNEY